MKTIFLGKEYVALSLIKAKNKIFHEKFITISELNQFEHFIQQEFNNQDLDVVITSNALSGEDFNIMGDVIMATDTCCFNLDLLPINVLTFLYDSNLIADFFTQIENEKLEILERTKSAGFKLCRKV